MRSRFDSSDIVQSVWSDALRGFREAGWRFTTTEQLRVFLVKMTRNRFIDRVRQHSASLDRERVIAQTGRDRHRDGVPGPGAAVEAAELWERILALCPPEHHALLRLKRQGLSNTEIAAMTGIHAGSVRRVLRELAVRVHTERGVAVSDNCR
jgi:RNA polymerase sigma factor (sigma-70 family)